MNLDVNNIIMFFDKFAGQETTDKEEMGEQDATPAAGSTGGGSVPKWADSYSIKRGKSNMLGKAGEKWNTGLTRGPGNQIW